MPKNAAEVRSKGTEQMSDRPWDVLDKRLIDFVLNSRYLQTRAKNELQTPFNLNENIQNTGCRGFKCNMNLTSVLFVLRAIY